MNHRSVSVAAIVACALLPAAAAAQSVADARWSMARTPWGEPDLQGIWTSATLTPLERPRRLAEQSELTEEEVAAMERQTIESRAASDGKSAPGSVGGYNQVWMDAGTAITDSRRTSLIVDPTDGVIPWAPGAQDAYDREVARYGVGPFDSWTDMDTGERCITDGLPNMVPLQPYNMNLQVLQTPGEVVMLHEMYHELRVIPIADRPLTGIAQWTGEARGRWEGDTLVVETANFLRETSFLAGQTGADLHLVERFTRVSPQTLMYEATVNDSSVWTRPWTYQVPMQLNDQPLFEYACHEGNYGLYNILAGARVAEAAAEAVR